MLTVKKISIPKAPDLDAIQGLTVKAATLNTLDLCPRSFNECLQGGCFPTQWKVQRLVLFPKGNKSPEEPSSYRLLCLLDIAGKLFERVICTRMKTAIEDAGGLANNQFGFRKARSTVGESSQVVMMVKTAMSGRRCTKRMCAIIALHIRNAFNSSRWGTSCFPFKKLRCLSTSVEKSSVT